MKFEIFAILKGNMMDKGFLIWMALVFLFLVGVPTLTEYVHSREVSQCKVAALQAGKSVEDIEKICK